VTTNVLKASDVVVLGDNDEIESESVRSVVRDAFEKGQAYATQALEREIESLRSAMATLTEAGCREVAESSRLDAEVVTSLAADLAAWFLNGVIEADPTLLMPSLQGALTEAAEHDNLVLWVHPLVADALESGDGTASYAVRGDPSLQPADFRLVADGTMIERRWRDALDQVGPHLAASLRSNNE